MQYLTVSAPGTFQILLFFFNLYVQHGAQTLNPEIKSRLLYQLKPGTPKYSKFLHEIFKKERSNSISPSPSRVCAAQVERTGTEKRAYQLHSVPAVPWFYPFLSGMWTFSLAAKS